MLKYKQQSDYLIFRRIIDTTPNTIPAICIVFSLSENAKHPMKQVVIICATEHTGKRTEAFSVADKYRTI